MEPLYRVIAALAKALMWVMGWRVLITDGARIPRQGPAVLACNHVSYWDPIMIGYAAQRRGRAVRFLAKDELFDKRGFGWLLRQVRQVPVDRSGHPERAIKPATDTLRAGELLGMFPEATISTSFVPKDARTGAARMALETGVPLVPVALWGGQRFATKHRSLNWQRGLALTVRVGEPLAYELDEDPRAVTDRLMKELTRLVDESARAYPQSPADDTDRWWLPAALGGTAPTPSEAAAARRERRRPRPSGDDDPDP
jgi:1-acyl-sn-glycerol-3-phosphate acyltransferase